MRNQEQAFRAYYASMRDSDLLMVANNRRSFIPIAQALLTEELLKRQLPMPSDIPAETSHAPTLFGKLRWLMRRGPRSEPANAEPDLMVRQRPTAPEGTVPTNSESTTRPRAVTSIGATEDQVSMVGIVIGLLRLVRWKLSHRPAAPEAKASIGNLKALPNIDGRKVPSWG